MKHINVTHTCDACDKEIEEGQGFEEVEIITGSSHYGAVDLCNLKCFIKWFNKNMKDDGIDVELRKVG